MNQPMFRCLNAGQIGIQLPWEQCLPLAKKNGFDGFDINPDPAVAASAYRDAMASHDLRVGAAGLMVDFREDAQAFQASMRDLPRFAKQAEQIGITRVYTWIVPAHDTLTYRQNFDQHRTRLTEVTRVLADHGQRLGLEFVAPKQARVGKRFGFIHTLDQVLELADAIGHGTGVLLDSWHWHTSLATRESLLALSAEQVVYVHVNDAPRGIDVGELEDCVRHVPGDTGVIDIGAFLKCLRTIGYDGPVVAEPFDATLKAMSPDAAADRVGRAMRRVWNMPARPVLPTTMKAIGCCKSRAYLVDLPVPKPRGNEVVVKVHVTPLCGSDLGAFRGEKEYINVGHEAAGEVVAVGPAASLCVGDRVALAPTTACGVCTRCRQGDIIHCQNKPPAHGHAAQFTRIADVCCIKLPDDVSYDHGSLLGCALGPAFESTRQLGLTAYDTVVIAGLGPVGLGATAIATALGARVIGLDPEPWRRDRATQLGASATLDPLAPDIREQLRALQGGDGNARAVECSGRPESQRLLIETTARLGRIALVGVNTSPIPITPWNDMIHNGLTLVGCWHMNMNHAGDLLTLIRRHPEKAELLISHRFGFSQVHQAHDVFASRHAAKVLVRPWE